MGILFAVLAGVIVLVAFCITKALENQNPTAQNPSSSVSVISIGNKPWLKPSVLLPIGSFACLVIVARNIQNGVSWTDMSWAFLVPIGLVAGAYLLPRTTGWVGMPVIEGAPPSPPWLHIFAKTALTYLAVVLFGYVIFEVISAVLENSPVLKRNVDEIGIGRIVGDLLHNPVLQFAVLALIFVWVFRRTNTLTQPEYVRPDGTSVVQGIPSLGSQQTRATTPPVVGGAAVAAASRQRSVFWRLVLFVLLAPLLIGGVIFALSTVWGLIPSMQELHERSVMFKRGLLSVLPPRGRRSFPTDVRGTENRNVRR